ncbi:MAG: thioredoxin domain-containing protein [Chitinophagales bacterium]|nr:thioredoxin domain-containing protein [Chitinophagales bacterium]
MKFNYTWLLCAGLVVTSCLRQSGNNIPSSKSDKMESNQEIKNAYTNQLIHESSPYLLQHAHNPVNWYPWGEAALDKAKSENKLLIISIGYSACHWCHVMEHESFEDTGTAKIMNENFVCIKVDREERPDIDQVYMNAVQLMTGSGGWPLNCIALPDGRPIYGGTYFPRKQWQNVLLNLADLYKNDPHKADDYAEKLTAGIQQSDLIKLNAEPVEFSYKTIDETVERWRPYFDEVDGGPSHAPKFPLPNNYQFLLRYAVANVDVSVKKQVDLTLKKMAFGGIYDHLGGGFSRYSVDSLWKVPHFEKMLYDNAQLISLYCNAYRENADPLYKSVVYETLEWINREMTTDEGAFYSALDADAEGKEGKYYIWTKEELQSILQNDFPIFAAYYNVNENGLWEDDHYILLRKESDQHVAATFGMREEALNNKLQVMKQRLLAVREQRIHPGLDDKTLTSWNAMMVRGYVDAYTTFDEPRFLAAAVRNAQFIFSRQLRPDGGLQHSYKNGTSSINGFLEDYAFVIDACIALYEATFDLQWLEKARQLTDYAVIHFYDAKEGTGMFWFTSDVDAALIARKMELQDNVIPSSNSVMAHNLFLLGNYFDSQQYLGIAAQMMHTMQGSVVKWGSSYANWCMLLMNYAAPFYEVAVIGKDAVNRRIEFGKYYLPDIMLSGSLGESTLPLLEHKYVKDETLIYVCVNKSCRLPVKNVEDAVKQIKKN